MTLLPLASARQISTDLHSNPVERPASNQALCEVLVGLGIKSKTLSFDNHQRLSIDLELTGPVIAKYIFAYGPRLTQLRVKCVTEVFQRIRTFSNVLGGMHIIG